MPPEDISSPSFAPLGGAPAPVQTPAPTPQPDEASHNIVSVFPVDPVTAAPIVASAPAADTPLSAADGDVIEKAWVEKVEKVIAQHKLDPHQQGEASERLSQEYLKQRFGLDVTKPGEKR